MASLMKPDEGICSMLGYDTVKDYREIRQMIGYMPGRFSLYMDLTVEENLDFYARVFGSSIQDNYELVREVYEQIAPFRKRRAGKLSGGMKQKLALSCALIHRPRVLILDEPTTGVDAVSRQEFWEMLKKIQQEGITIVVSTPYMDEAALCDRVALIQGGSILHVSVPGELGSEREEHIYALRSERGVYAYLDLLRGMPEVQHAWLFGDSLHVVLHAAGDAAAVESALKKNADPSLAWEAIPASIEDRFMGLLAGHDKNQELGKG
jgi:ABC-type multidrug transport system ATPase subunit